MSRQVFNEIFFECSKDLYLEVLENPDQGFGYKIHMKKADLTEMQQEVMDFLLKCQQKGILGRITITFNREAVGEAKTVSRTIERIEKSKVGWIISNSY